jgi:predicted neutral ceramidase superfamily lipid hydrolase
VSRNAALLVFVAAFTGAALAAGVMWWRMTADGFDYTRSSWLLIPVLWAAPVVAAALASSRPMLASALLIAAAVVASTYFRDVWGFVPGAVIFGCGIELGLRAVHEGGLTQRRDGI